MADYCVACKRRWPTNPVRVLIIGDSFIEFCDDCRDDESVLMRPDGTPVSLGQAWLEAHAAREASEAR